jgi:hypothetical protein
MPYGSGSFEHWSGMDENEVCFRFFHRQPLQKISFFLIKTSPGNSVGRVPAF